MTADDRSRQSAPASFPTALRRFRALAGWKQSALAMRLQVHELTVSRWECGKTWPTLRQQVRLCEALNASAEELGLSGVSTRDAPTVRLRPQLLVPQGYADDEYVHSVRERTHEIIDLENRFGGAELALLAARFLRSVKSQIELRTYRANIERDLCAAAGELAELAGWLFYDADQQASVYRMNQEALHLSERAGDAQMKLLTLQNIAMHAGFLDRPREALDVASSVLEGGDRLAPRVRMLFLTRKARALAQGGDVYALEILSQVRALHLDGVRDDDPPWAWWVDDRELAWHHAMALTDLGQPKSALPYHERAVAATEPDQVRSLYLHLAYLLEAQVRLRSWTDVQATMKRVGPLASEVASTRTVVLLKKALLAIETTDAPAGALDAARKLEATLSQVGHDLVSGGSLVHGG